MGVLFGYILPSQGQVYSGNADMVVPVEYDVYEGSDELFVFYQKEGNFKSGSLSIDWPGPGLFDFEWTKYDFNADAFSILVDTENGNSSTINDLDEGGYQVRITDGGTLDTTFVTWVMLDNFFVGTEKDDEGMVKWHKSGCSDWNYLSIDGIVEADSFFFYDLSTHDPIRFVNDYDFVWTSDNAEIELTNATKLLSLNETDINPDPVEDTYFILTATDSLGMTEIDSVFYDTKFTRAEFTLEYYDKITKDYSADLTESWSLETGSLDAPLTVRFLNESKNGAEFTWVYLDTINEITKEGTKVYEEITDEDYEPEFTYYNADTYYYPYLVSISDVGCIDTFLLEDGIKVVPSDLLVPNVFSPNGDESNEYWLFKHQSLKECEVTIISKFGTVVYKRKIDDIYLWEGWHGTILNSSRPAPEGPYYYIIEALGYDNVEYKDPNVIERWKIDRQQGSTGTTTTGTGTEPDTQISTIYTGWLYLYRNSGQY